MENNWNHITNSLGTNLLQMPSKVKHVPSGNSFTTDTRKISTNQWFVPLKGITHNGHKFLAKFLKDKPEDGALCEQEFLHMVPETLHPRLLVVKDSLKAYQQLAHGWRQKFSSLELVALTGSVGKTTCKQMLGQILKQHESHATLPFAGNFNNEIGVPQTLLTLNSKHKFAVLELGARNIGHIETLVQMVDPTIKMCLNVGSAHIGEFKSLDNTYKAKLEIFTQSPRTHSHICFHDDKKLLFGAKKEKIKLLSFGTNRDADVKLIKIQRHKDKSSRIHVLALGNTLEIRLPSAHEGLTMNALAAVAAAKSLNINNKSICQGLENFENEQGRYQLHHTKSLSIIDDTYNSSPESASAGLKSFAEDYKGEKKVVILGDMLELGTNTQEEHEKLGEICATEVRPELLISIGKDSIFTTNAAKNLETKGMETLHFPNCESFLKEKFRLDSFGSILYIKGSRGIHLEKIVESLLHQDQ